MYLLSNCPESIRQADSNGYLPLHNIIMESEHQSTRAVAVCLLRKHPVSYCTFRDAVSGSKDTLIHSVCTVFDSRTTSTIQNLLGLRVEQIAAQLYDYVVGSTASDDAA